MSVPKTCIEDGCFEQVPRGYCPKHRKHGPRSASSSITGTARWRRLKSRLLALPQNRWCSYCHEAPATTLDHSKPVSTHPHLAWVESNLVPSCEPCNQAKGGRS